MELANSKIAATKALETVLQAAPPKALLVDGRNVSIKPVKGGVQCEWTDGSLTLLMRTIEGSVTRAREDDKGHKLSLQIVAHEKEEREVIFVSFEWALRDAIRENRDAVPLRAANSYITRKKDVEVDRDISGYGPLSREIAKRSGIGASPNVELGTFSINSGSWSPDPSEVLRRMITLAIIKTHFLDRGEEELFEGEPLFEIPEAADAAGKLDALLAFPGTPSDTLAGIASWIGRCEELPKKGDFVSWAMREHKVSRGRVTSVLRTLHTVGFLETKSGALGPTDDGRAFRKSPDAAVLGERLIRHYRGFETALRFFERKGSGHASDVREYLNERLRLEWQSPTQTVVRLTWLLACGLVANDGGNYSLTPRASEFLRAIPEDLADQPKAPWKSPEWREDPEHTAELLKRLFPDEKQRLAAVSLAGRVVEILHREGAARWGVTLHTDRININAGRTLALGLIEGSKIFVGLAFAKDDAARRKEAESLGQVLESFKVLPDPLLLEIPASQIGNLLERYSAELDRFLAAAAGTASQMPWTSSFSPGVLAHFEELLGRDLPVPEYEAGETDDGEIEYWKVSPGENGSDWEHCQQTQSIGLGWNDLGDLTGMDRDAFEAKVVAVQEIHPHYSDAGVEQVWKFSRIPVGSIIVANRGTTEILGIGRVTEPYRFVPDASLKHRLGVTWISTKPISVKRGGWRKTLIELDRETFEAIVPGFRLEGAVATTQVAKPAVPRIQETYELDRLVAETGLAKEKVESWLRILNRKKQVVLQGPPGTGKTWVAKRLARHVVAGTDGFTDIVQFHPAYSYEDFIQGLRPTAGSGGQITFNLEAGHFLKFCRRATETEAPCVLIIDEINRANIPRVFGELMYLLEYRTEKVALASGGQLEIPKNVLMIGTMNTADRSIARLDHALRRRFSFLSLNPDYEILRRDLKTKGLDADGLVSVLDELNGAIRDPHYFVGISYFMSPGDLRKSLGTIWECEIEPYLEEYFYDAPDKVNHFRWSQLAKTKLKSFSE